MSPFPFPRGPSNKSTSAKPPPADDARRVCPPLAKWCETVSETRNPNEAADVGKDRFQFSIRQMLVLTTVSAAAAAMASSIHAPDVCRGIVAAYLILMAAYAVLRLPYMCRGIMRRTPRWDRIRRQRSDLEAMALNMKREIEQARLSANTDQPHGPTSSDQPHD